MDVRTGQAWADAAPNANIAIFTFHSRMPAAVICSLDLCCFYQITLCHFNHLYYKRCYRNLNPGFWPDLLI